MMPIMWGLSGAAVATSLVMLVTFASPIPAAGDVTTVDRDATRIGWDPDEPGLGPAALASSDFGRIFATQVDGQVYAQPLVIGGTVVVATEHNQTYGLDAANGEVKWHDNLGPAWPASAIRCGDLSPDIGVTSTPVYDPATNSVYLTAKTNDGHDVQHPHWYMHSLDPQTGHERPGWPVAIGGSPSNDRANPFNPKTEGQRPGLLLLGGVVYAAFAAHCDHGLWRGYLAGVSTTAAKLVSLWAAEAGSATKGAGIWMSGGGVMSDGPGRVFLTTGNGVSPPAGPGNRPPRTLAESVVRLQASAGRPPVPVDFFSPANAPSLDLKDADLSGGGPVALPPGFGTRSHPHVLIQQGKDGRIFLLDRDHLGGREQGRNRGDAVLSKVGPYQGQWNHPAAWTGDGAYVYLVDNGGPLRALRAGQTRWGVPTLTLAGTSADNFPYTSGSPVITSAGNAHGSGVVWVVWVNGPQGGNAQLRAYSAVPNSTGRLRLLFSAPIGTAVKFAVPATDGNRVYVGTRDGRVLGFGRPMAAPLTGRQADFGSVRAGTTSTRILTLTATHALTINALAVPAPFRVNPLRQPLTLKRGDQLNLPVSFTPSRAGAASEILTVGTNVGEVGFSLNGVATKPGLSATPASAAFAAQPVGGTSTVNVQVTNGGASSETISSATAPAGPFKVSGLPAPRTLLRPGDSFVLSVSYAPSKPGNNISAIVIRSSSGLTKIPVTGRAVTGKGRLVLTPPVLDFGSQAPGSTRTRWFDITNVGNLPVTITKAKAPAGVFTAAQPLAEGTVIGPGQVIHQAVSFTPHRPGKQTDRYAITGDSGQGAMAERLVGMGAVMRSAVARQPVGSVPASLDFGDVQVGDSDTERVTVTNQGPWPETVTAVTRPAAPFSAELPPAGTRLAPHASLSIPVRFAPTADGTVAQTMTINTAGGSTVVPLTGTGNGQLPAFGVSSWVYGGLTTLANNTVTLTKDGQRWGAGSMISSAPISPLGLHATFTAELGGARDRGGDGLTFALFDAAATKPGAVGLDGAGLGVAGLPAVFAALDTHPNGKVNQFNFAGVGRSAKGSAKLDFLRTTTAIPDLRAGTHLVDVMITRASHLVLAIDNRAVLDVPVQLPSKVLAGFTGSVGGDTDDHIVINPVVSYGS
jgi:Abnormal spindle-like microcephaly-assoc'd, ASPM-SPD-2-Hydin/Bacterial lectin/PQQ-like domain